MSQDDSELEACNGETMPGRSKPLDDDLVQIVVPLELAELLSSGRGLEDSAVVERFCRVCLNAGAEMICIFATTNDEQLSQMLESFARIQLAPGDRMPTKVCPSCRQLILQCYNFKQICERTDTTLRAFLHGDVVYKMKSEEVCGNYNQDVAEDSEEFEKKSPSSDVAPDSHLKYDIDALADKELNYTDLLNDCPKSTRRQDSINEIKPKKEKNIKLEGKSCTKKQRKTCVLCDKSFKDTKELAQHMVVHASEPPGKCTLCGKTFKSDRGLQRHLKTAHCESEAERLYKCSRCESTFISEKDLNIHSAIHKVGLLTCFECHKSFTTLVQLKRHIKRHMDEKPYKCEICYKTFCEVFALYRHQRCHFGTVIEKKYECSVCNKKFAEKSVLTVHMRRHTGERPFECVKCGKNFLSMRLLTSHMRTHTDDKPHKCDFCGKSFRHTATLATHRRTHTGERPYVCSVCGKAFIQSSNLTLHSRVHSGERPYACSVCDSRFTSWSTMKTHERVHTGEKPYSCKICGQRFARLGLKSHMRWHSGERPYTCMLCDKSFFTPRRLAEHNRAHSGIKPFDCGVCGLKLGTKRSLLHHMKHHIGNRNTQTQKTKASIITKVDVNQSESTEASALQICDYVDGTETIIDQSGNIEESIREQEELVICYDGHVDVPTPEVSNAAVSTAPIVAIGPGKGRRLNIFRIESSNRQLFVNGDSKGTQNSNYGE